MEKDKLERHTSIIGRVVTIEWAGAVNGIEILTNEDSYTVELDYVGKQLLEFSGKDIKAIGYVNIYADGTNRILLDDFEILNEDEILDEDYFVPDVEAELDLSDDYLLEEDR